MRNIHKRFRYLIQVFIVIGVIFSHTNCQSVSAATLGDSGSASLGSYVTFGGKTWRVIGDNYLMLDQKDSDKAYWPTDLANPSCIFNPNASSNLAYYLNNTFYTALGANASLIQNWNWTTGTNTNESLTSAYCKVGLISYSEWNNVKANLENKTSNVWTRTREASGYLWYADTSGTLQKALYNNSYGVYPTVHLKAGIDISSGTGTSGDPYILASASTSVMPTISISTPTVNNTYSTTNNIISLTGQVKGANVGDVLKVYYRIDGDAGTAGTQAGTDITSDGTNQNYSCNIDVSAVALGTHMLNVWVEENNGRKTAQTSIIFAMASCATQFGDSSSASLGSYVTFCGKTWRVIGDNYLMLDQIDCNKKIWPTDTTDPSCIFNPSNSSNAAYYLNNTFYTALGANASLIQNWNWTTGTNTTETLSSASCKVGLISYSEWSNIKPYLENKGFNIWTRTREASSYLWYVNVNGNLQKTLYDNSYGLYPTIHLKAGIDISSGTGTSDNPYVLAAAPTNEIPTISVSTAAVNDTYSATNNIISLIGQVKGANVGDILKVYYRIDGDIGTSGTQAGTDITSNGANQNYSCNIDVSAVAVGRHVLNVWVKENNGRQSCETQIIFSIASYKPQLADNTASLGSYVTFGGMTWRVIGDNYLMLDQYYTEKTFGSSTFNPSNSSNIAYYVNDTFYNALGTDTELIQSWDWTTGINTNESSSSTNCNVGLISYSEWNNIKAYMDSKNFYIWTRTPTNIGLLWYVNFNGNLGSSTYDTTYAVYPTIHLKSGITISSGNGLSESPYTLEIISIVLNAPSATDIANNGDGRDIQVTFNGAADETNVSSYRIFVVKTSDAATFDKTTAVALASSRYVEEAKTTAGAAHTLTLTQNLLDSAGDAIVNGTSYKVFVLAIAGVGSNVLSTGSSSLTLGLTLQGITTMTDAVKDLFNYGDGRDIRVMFKGAPSESNISGYRVIVVRTAISGTFDEGIASGLASTSYVADPVKGAVKIHLVYLTQDLQNSEGNAITGGVPYTVYVLTLGKNGYTNVLTSVGSVTLDTNNEGYRVTAPKPVVLDAANNGNGTDIKVTFRRSKSEVNVQEYRIIVSTTALTLTAAESVPVAGY